MLNELAKQTFEIAKARGFYPDYMTFKQLMRAMENESAEMAEAYYKNDFTGNPDSMDIELVDRLIVALSDCYYFGIDIDTIFKNKLEYNKTRI